MRTNSTIAYLGAGNLARSLIAGLLRHGHPADRVWASARSADKRDSLSQAFGIHTTSDNRAAASGADIVVLAVKPQQLAGLCRELAGLDLSGKLTVSVAAGTTTASIQTHLGQAAALVRAMPNTPSAIGLGATGLFATTTVSAEQKADAEAIFRAVGEAVWVADEAQMDVVTAVAGSGPAYYFLFMEAMQAAAEELGLSPEVARLLVRQTALGAVNLANQRQEALSELRRQVTSPGGTTAAALGVFEHEHLSRTVAQALAAAVRRGQELARAAE